MDFRPERADFRSERADSRPARADFRPERADFSRERADFRLERADFRPDRAWGGTLERTNERTKGQTKVPCVPPSGPLPKKEKKRKFGENITFYSIRS